MQVTRPNQRVPGLMYIYDAAGEFFGDENRTMSQGYFQYVNGLILIVDPFSIDMVQDIYEDQLEEKASELAPSTENIENVYGRMITVLEAKYNLKKGQKFPQPLAVILTKIDAF